MAERKAEKLRPAKPPAGLGLDEPALSPIMGGVKGGVGGKISLPTRTSEEPQKFIDSLV